MYVDIFEYDLLNKSRGGRAWNGQSERAVKWGWPIAPSGDFRKKDQRENRGGLQRIYPRTLQVSAITSDMDSTRAILTFAVASLAWLLIFNFKSTDAQVTFSRDWNAGKRSVSLSECSAPLRSANAVCQMLLNELRAITSCELRSLLVNKGDDTDSVGDVFLSQRTG